MSTINTSLAGGDLGSQETLCPYVDCNNKFPIDLKDCPACLRPISRCPNGHMFAAMTGFCDYCGYDTSTATNTPADTTKVVLGPDDITELVADAYRAAAMSGANMRSATELLEGLRETLGQQSNYHEAWDKFDDHIARTLDKRLREIVLDAREAFIDRILNGEIACVSATLEVDQARGWREWLQTLSSAIVNWRLLLAKFLANAPLNFSPNNIPVLVRIRRDMDRVIEERWPESFTMFCYLAAQDAIEAADRARLLVIAAEIELYQLKRSDRARLLLEQAEQLGPEVSRVKYGLGEYYLQEREFSKALAQAELLKKNFPQSSQGYVLEGDCFEQQGELDKADTCYQEALRVSPGETAAYGRLIRLYGRPERLSNFENRLLPILELACVIDPLNRYSLLVDLGTAYQQNTRYDEAHSYYDEAIELNERQLSGYITKGYAYLEQQKPKQALEMFETAIRVAPEATDGYWGLYYLHDQASEWKEAADAYEKSLEHSPEVLGLVLDFEDTNPGPNNIGEVIDRLIDTLAHDPENNTILNSLLTLAELYNKSQQRSRAKLLYDRIRTAKGERFEGQYQNLIGNADYYWSDYQGAVDSYSKAAAAEPNESVYHSNLSLAYQGLKELSKARDALEKASQLDTDGSKYQKRFGDLANDEGNEYYGNSEFTHALDCYTKAISFDQSNAVYYSNQALAWENLTTAASRVEALEKAVNALNRAIALDSADPTYPARRKALESELTLARSYGEHIIGKTPTVTPIAIDIADDLVPYVEREKGISAECEALSADLRRRISESFGISLPGIRFRRGEFDSPGTYLISLMDVPTVVGSISLNKRLFVGTGSQLSDLGVEGDPGLDPLNGHEAYWVDQQKVEALGPGKLSTWSLLEYPIRHLESLVRRNLSEFVDHQEVAALLASYDEGLKVETESLTAFTIVLRALVSEQVPLTPIDLILRQISELLDQHLDLVSIVEEIRFLPAIRLSLPGNNSAYSFYRLGERMTSLLDQSVREGDHYQFLALEPEKCQEALAAVRDKVLGKTNIGIVAENSVLRPLLRRLIELEFPDIPILALKELLTAPGTQVVGEIELL